MNCLEFRRLLSIDPLRTDDESAAHEAECASCAAHAREVRATELQLRALIDDVKVPEGMAERVQLAVHAEASDTHVRRWWIGAAATVLLAIGVSLGSLWSTGVERERLALAQSVIHHIEDEAAHLHEAHPVSRGRVNYVFDRFGAELAGDIGPVHFAAECLMRERNGIHLVLPGSRGAITVFLMPGEMADGVLPVQSPRFAGRIVPTGWGSIAVVGEQGEAIDGIGEKLAGIVRWPGSESASSQIVVGGIGNGITLAAAQK
jgi:hypothetical protein